MKRGRVLHVCISPDLHTAKQPVAEVRLRADHGLEGDAHAGPGHRQVSLLDQCDIDDMQAQGLDLAPGAFGENIVVRDQELAALGIGTRLRVGAAELEITQIGKVCHNRCAIYAEVGDCIMPRAGLFARVVRDGVVRADDATDVIEFVSRDTIQAAVLTASDRCAAGAMEDASGPAVARALRDSLKAHICWTGVRADDEDAIESVLRDLAGRGIDMIITVGGTGLGPRDVTPEATRAVIDREVPGLAETMRTASARITPNAWLQRGICGIRHRTLILNLPGSPAGAVENLTAVADVLPHAIRLLRGQTNHA
jgi:molybdenum cofactor synthesis domain-containing protein